MSLEKTHEHILSKNCQIQIFGSGYVGFPLAIRPYSAGSICNLLSPEEKGEKKSLR